MASVKKSAVGYGALFLIIAYMVLSIFDYCNDSAGGRKETFRAHLLNLRAERFPVGGLILGGSNAYYGLSAGLLGEELGVGFYNAALSSEGFTQLGYDRFIETLISKHVLPADVRWIVYSSVSPLRVGAIAAYRDGMNRSLWGGPSIGIKRYKSIYKEYVEPLFMPRSKKAAPQKSYPLPDSRGDLDFSTALCVYTEKEQPELEEAWQIVDFFVSRQKVLRQIFPNAKIVFVLPSEYSAYGQHAAAKLDALKALFDEMVRDKAYLIVQPPIPSLTLVCNERHHPNERGRAWRTRDLAERLKSLSSSKE